MPFPFPSAGSPPSAEQMWTTAFEKLSQSIRSSFIRSETRQHALTYSHDRKLLKIAELIGPS